jgi:hypothetical protein
MTGWARWFLNKSINKLSHKIKITKHGLFKDLKILYPDYLKIKELGYLTNKIEII